MSGTDLILPNGTVVPVRDNRGARRGELRDPRAATQRMGWSSPDRPQIEEWNAEQALRLGYASNVIAYRCVQLRAKGIAAVPLVAGRRKGDATSINPNAAITKLLGPPPGGPAPKLSATKLIRWTMAQKITTGRRAWEIETATGTDRPVAFWPLAASSLRPVPSTSGTEWFRLFHYGPEHDPVKLKPENVFYGWDPSGTDFRQAESEFQAARFDLSLVNLCDRYSLGFLRNNAVPAAVITTTAFPDEASRRKFTQNWQSEFGGPERAGRVAINEVGDDGDGPVGDSIDIKVLGLSAKDARLVEQRRDIMHEIAIALGVPWSKLDASGRTFANAEQEDLDFWENTQLPDLVDLEDDINMQLAPRLGDEVVWFDLRHVRALKRKVNPVTAQVGAPSMVQAQLMQINEARVDYGLEPIEGGDRFMTAEEIVALNGMIGTPDVAVRALEAIEARMVAIETRTAEPEPPPPEPEPQATPEGLDAIEARRARIWRAADAVVTGLEARWERSWARMFSRQEQAVIDRLTGKRGRQALGYGTDGQPTEVRAEPTPIDAEAIFTRTFWVAESEQLALDLFEETAAAGLARLSMAFGIGFDIAAPWVQDFITARSNQLAGQVTSTTYDAIQAELVAGVANGESIDDLATRVRSVFAHANKTRSTVIARTEVISAYNGSAALGATQLPADVVAGQEWIATRDGRTRGAHASADGSIVAIGSAFEVGGDSLAYPGDPAGRAANTIQCRCTVAFLTPEEYIAATSRAKPTVEHRAARMALAMVGPDFDPIRFRRALEAAA